MQMNGFSAGVEPGGLYRMADIQLLICYILASVPDPLPRSMLMDVVVGNGMANFFETTEALENLLTVGSVSQDDSEDQRLTVSDNGKAAVNTLYDRLPLTLRERSVKSALQALARRRNEQETDVTVTPLTHGCSVSCSIKDGEAPLMSLQLKVADEQQADMIRNRFLDDPGILYRSIIAILTGRYFVREVDGKPVIQVL